MKENNLNRVIGWSGLLLTSLLSTSALADNIGTSAEELGLSDYRHFVIYPRLDKALKAQKNNDKQPPSANLNIYTNRCRIIFR